MSVDLINSVANGDYVSANRLFEQRLENILEKKLYERKRMVAAEAFGGLTKSEIEDRKKKGFVKASDVLLDPRDIKIPLRKKEAAKRRKKVSEETLDEAGLGQGARIAHKGRAKHPILTSIARNIQKVRVGYRVGYRKSQQSQQPTTSDDEAMLRAAGAEPSTSPKSTATKRPGIVRRNVNTLMGREPGYVAPEKTPEQKGGRAGKAVRFAAKGWANVLRSGMSGPLEE